VQAKSRYKYRKVIAEKIKADAGVMMLFFILSFNTHD
jgi:hypothetical protein